MKRTSRNTGIFQEAINRSPLGLLPLTLKTQQFRSSHELRSKRMKREPKSVYFRVWDLPDPSIPHEMREIQPIRIEERQQVRTLYLRVGEAFEQINLQITQKFWRSLLTSNQVNSLLLRPSAPAQQLAPWQPRSFMRLNSAKLVKKESYGIAYEEKGFMQIAFYGLRAALLPAAFKPLINSPAQANGSDPPQSLSRPLEAPSPLTKLDQ